MTHQIPKGIARCVVGNHHVLIGSDQRFLHTFIPILSFVFTTRNFHSELRGRPFTAVTENTEEVSSLCESSEHLAWNAEYVRVHTCVVD